MQVLTSNEFVGVYDVALTDVRLLEIGSAEAADEICSLEPGNYICSNQEEDERQRSGEDQGP